MDSDEARNIFDGVHGQTERFETVQVQVYAPTPPETAATSKPELASFGRRIAASVIDGVLTNFPYGGMVFSVIYLVMLSHGRSLGLAVTKLRIVRGNGDVSGFFHTWVRASAAIVSLLPLGAGYFAALWDDDRQTWHDKIMDTYVVLDTPEISARKSTNSPAAVLWFWITLGIAIAAGVALSVWKAQDPDLFGTQM